MASASAAVSSFFSMDAWYDACSSLAPDDLRCATRCRQHFSHLHLHSAFDDSVLEHQLDLQDEVIRRLDPSVTRDVLATIVSEHRRFRMRSVVQCVEREALRAAIRGETSLTMSEVELEEAGAYATVLRSAPWRATLIERLQLLGDVAFGAEQTVVASVAEDGDTVERRTVCNGIFADAPDAGMPDGPSPHIKLTVSWNTDAATAAES